MNDYLNSHILQLAVTQKAEDQRAKKHVISVE